MVHNGVMLPATMSKNNVEKKLAARMMMTMMNINESIPWLKGDAYTPVYKPTHTHTHQQS